MSTMKSKTGGNQSGFTLMESLVSIAVFTLMVMAINQTASAIINNVTNLREKTAVAGLADQYLEIARNLPYSQIGTSNGNPHGNLPDLPNAINTTANNIAYQIYYVVNYIDDPADGTFLAGTDTNPQDYKQIKLYVKNVSTGATTSFLTNVAPKGLEGMGSGGALLIKVFDAVGQPVPNASIAITNTALSPQINLSRLSDAQGNWAEVGLPESAGSYHVVVTKNGYSSDQTYPTTAGNPNPTKPDSTILSGQVTQVSFAIDHVSNLTFNNFNQSCSPLAGIGMEVQGSKLIGTSPNVLKFDNSYTSDSGGQTKLGNIEWDNYVPAMSSADYVIYGSAPTQQISVLPNTNQNYNLILGPKTDNSLLVIVKDAATGNPIKGASVNLQTVNPPSDSVKLTAGDIWSQADWSGGGGQNDWSDVTRYALDDGNVSGTDIPSGLRLANYGGASYAAAGSVTSSTFDTATTTNSYSNLVWQPTSQDPATSVKFQIASNNDNATWNYTGPDGTSGSYFTVPGNVISPVNNDNRYIRYRAYLSTSDTSKTPVITSVGVNYVSGCFTPGQAVFSGLNGALNYYTLVVSMAGYQTQTIGNITVNGYQMITVQLSQ